MENSSPRILIVEDDIRLARSLCSSLRQVGYEVCSVADGTTIDHTVDGFHPDLTLLDVRLPIGPDGFEIARLIRARTSAPILFLTASDNLDDRLEGFDVGADDYIVKPVALAELLARVRAVLRRSGRLVSAVREIRGLLIDEVTRTVTRAGKPVDLTPTEFELLCTLMREPGRVFTKLQLLSLVWGFEDYDQNLVEVYVSSLRRKLDVAGAPFIRTERGRGYVIAP